MENKSDGKCRIHVGLPHSPDLDDALAFSNFSPADMSRRLAYHATLSMIKLATEHKADKVYNIVVHSIDKDGRLSMNNVVSCNKEEIGKLAKEHHDNYAAYDISHLYKKSDSEFEEFMLEYPAPNKEVEDAVRAYRRRMLQTTIHLPLKRKWFEMIATGEKREEYREVKAKYLEMFCSQFPLREEHHPNHNNDFSVGFHLHWPEHYDQVVFTLGYPKAGDDAHRLVFNNPQVRIGTGKPEWGAEPGKMYFVITWEVPWVQD